MHGSRLTAALAAVPLVFAVTAIPTQAAPVPQQQQHHLYTLPTGDHVRVSGQRADFVPAPGHDSAAVTTWIDGRLTVVPVSEFGHLTSLSQFELGDQSAAMAPNYPMSLLHIKALDHAGKPAQAAEVIAINTDDPTKANWDGIMTAGDSRVQVPAGHYSVAVAVFEPGETDLLTLTDVTVPADGTTVTLDGRAAQQVSFNTPLPSTFSAAAVGWKRGTAAREDTLNIGALAGTRLYVTSAPKAEHGTMAYSVVGRQESPPSTPEPYSYLVAEQNSDRIPASQTYQVPASSLATVDSTYATDQPGQDLTLWDSWSTANGALLPDLPKVSVHAPAKDRRYISAAPSLIYDGLMLPNTGTLEGELERKLVLQPGQHLSPTWRGGVIVPAPATYDGPCFLCRAGNVLHGIGAMDTDVAGDNGQWSEGPTTITQDGKVIYNDSTMGRIFDQALPAEKHRYVYSIDTKPLGTNTTNLSTHSQISWGFDSEKSTAPLQILYAATEFAADAHNSVATGPASVTVSFQHQPGAADPDVKEAAVSISYDEGKTWQPTTVALTDSHHARGTWTVPADTKPGYLAVRIHGVDAAGSTLDETVAHAALVNAPGGIATTSSPLPAGQRNVCQAATAGHARCLAVATAARWQPSETAKLPDGLARKDLLSAYNLPSAGASGTVAIVDAHDDPTAEADLAVYRSTYGLPPCTTANGCFKKVNQQGETAPLPAYDPNDDWSGEVSLDLDMVSAVCPACHILLVESDSAETGSLGAAEQTATSSGAVAVSNSWGGDEGSENQQWNSAFQHPGVAVTASSGDAGFRPASWPASLSSVIAVGGTSLTKSSTARGWTETAWARGGSGCSGYVGKPAWQHDTHCSMRTVADVSAVGDPKTGVAVYVQGEWGVFGGTSASSPIIASMIALAGNSAALPNAKFLYSHASALYDITSGSNANWTCGGDYLCTAGKGYDAPTGMGSPHGLGAL